MWRKQIAFVTHSFDAVRLGGVIQQLFTQPRDGDVDAAVHTVVTDAAQVFQQRITVHDLPGMSGQFP
ncbi:hypothetical protein D3C80_2203200 [compost metagenome]